jgi:hypothetical protein
LGGMDFVFAGLISAQGFPRSSEPSL